MRGTSVCPIGRCKSAYDRPLCSEGPVSVEKNECRVVRRTRDTNKVRGVGR